MKRLLLLLLPLCAVINVKGQTQFYGQIDTADLKLTTCDFEKDANAMVLFDSTVITSDNGQLLIKYHRRVKVLTPAGLNAANALLYYVADKQIEKVKNLRAQTINLQDGIIKITPVDESSIYSEQTDKRIRTKNFSFPNARVGSVLELEYSAQFFFGGIVNSWPFQGDLPVRYAVFDARIISPGRISTVIAHTTSPLNRQLKEAIRNKQGDSIGVHYLLAVKDIESFKDEAFMTTRADNIQKVDLYSLSNTVHSWDFVAFEQRRIITRNAELDKGLKDDARWLDQASELSTDDKKIAFLFNKVKTGISWNGKNQWYGADKLNDAWTQKKANSADMNLILYYFLHMAGIKANPVFVSTRDHGKVNLDLPIIDNFNTMGLSVNTSAGKAYLLDASGKYNRYDMIPFNLLNCSAMTVDIDKQTFDISVLKNNQPSRQGIIVTAQIKPDGKIEGSAQRLSFGYDRSNKLEEYNKDSEDKYIKELKDGDDNVTITNLKRGNVEIDSLPLTESFDFKTDLKESDGDYIYINPNNFSGVRTNPFLSEKRNTTIDFGYLNIHSIKGFYKLPPGYKIVSVPKGTALSMPDTSITFKRMLSEDEKSVFVNYIIDRKKAVFPPDEYPAIRDFYKKMFEMLNEQIVLKKI